MGIRGAAKFSKAQQHFNASARNIHAIHAELTHEYLDQNKYQKFVAITSIKGLVRAKLVIPDAVDKSHLFFALKSQCENIFNAPAIIKEGDTIAGIFRTIIDAEDPGVLFTLLRDWIWMLPPSGGVSLAPKLRSTLKKQQGIFETPPIIARFLFLAITRFGENILHVCDPSCGSGNLLQPFWEDEKEYRVIGIDTDEIGLMLAEVRNLLVFEHRQDVPIARFLHEDFLTSPAELQVDVIVANPPWGLPKKIMQNYDKSAFPISYNNQADSWALFLERATIHIASGSGLLAFIIPNTLCLNPNFEKLREYLLRNFTILLVINIGERIFPQVTQPAMLFIARNTPPSPDHEIFAGSFLGDTSRKPRIDQLSKWLPQTFTELEEFFKNLKRFPQRIILETPGYRIEIFSSPAINNVLNKMQEECSYTFGDFVKNGRGVEIGKHAIVIQCPSCEYWNPPPKWKDIPPRDSRVIIEKVAPCNHCRATISDSPDLQHLQIISNNPADLSKDKREIAEIIVGEQLSQFMIKDHKYIRLNLNGINYKDSSIYTSPKILVRKTGRLIHAAIDWDNRYTVQVVYIFQPKQIPAEQVPITVLLCLLNSRLLHFYYYHRFGDPEKRNYAHYIQKHLKLLPIPSMDSHAPTASNFSILEAICQADERFGEGGIQETDRNTIDAAVYALYGLTPEEVRIVEEWTKNF